MRSIFASLHRRFGTPMSPQQKRALASQHIADHTRRFPDVTLPSSTTRPPPGNVVDVAVIGGGFAGLSCALNLPQQLSVVVLEARDRVGGRVQSLSSFTPGRLIEGGAELIGFNHPMWLRLSTEFGLGLSMITNESQFDDLQYEAPLVIGGTRLPASQANQVYQNMDAVMRQLGTRAQSEITDPIAPWTVRNAAALDAQPLSDELDRLAQDALTRAALEAEFANDNTMATNLQALLGTLTVINSTNQSARYWELVEVARCENGNQALANAMDARNRSNGVDVWLSTECTGIEIPEEGNVHITTSSPTGQGDLYARFVVLAVPQAVWNRITVQPAIPANFVIQNGPAVKFLSTVQERFWVRSLTAPTTVNDAVGLTWEGTDNQMVVTNEGIDLSLFAGGPAAASALAAPNAEAFYRPHLDQAFQNQYSRNLSQSQFMAWPNETFTGTGYSCPGLNQITTVGAALNSSFQDRLFFAGEHCCFRFFGFMEGALQSGLDAATRVAVRHQAGP